MFVSDPADLAWVVAAQKHARRGWLENGDLDVHLIGDADEQPQPAVCPVVRLSTRRRDDSYVLSTRSAWVRYPLAEAKRQLSPRCHPFLPGLGYLAGGFLSLTRLDRSVSVGNYLVSTNLYPEPSPTVLAPLIPVLEQQFPSDPIILRSVCPAINPVLATTLEHLGFKLLVARKIYICDPASPAVWKHNHVRKDQKLLDDGEVERIAHDQIKPTDLPELHRLFRMLFIDKHSPLNPAFSLAFFEFCLSSRFLELVALRHAGKWVGVIGLYIRHGWITTPLIGYDTGYPQSLGLYRRLMAILYREAGARHLKLHLSSGADSFKSARGGQAHLEYTAVYTRHLPASLRLSNRIFAGLVNRFAPRALERTG